MTFDEYYQKHRELMAQVTVLEFKFSEISRKCRHPIDQRSDIVRVVGFDGPRNYPQGKQCQICGEIKAHKSWDRYDELHADSEVAKA